jgi:hypothetical protein
MLRYVVYFFELLDWTNNRLEVTKRGDPSWEIIEVIENGPSTELNKTRLRFLNKRQLGMSLNAGNGHMTFLLTQVCRNPQKSQTG